MDFEEVKSNIALNVKQNNRQERTRPTSSSSSNRSFHTEIVDTVVFDNIGR